MNDVFVQPSAGARTRVNLSSLLVEMVVQSAREFQMTPAELAGALGVSETCVALLMEGDLALARYSCACNRDWVQDAGSMTRVGLRFVRIASNLSFLLDSHEAAVTWLKAQGHWHLMTQANSSFRPLFDVVKAEYDRRQARGGVGGGP